MYAVVALVTAALILSRLQVVQGGNSMGCCRQDDVSRPSYHQLGKDDERDTDDPTTGMYKSLKDEVISTIQQKMVELNDRRRPSTANELEALKGWEVNRKLAKETEGAVMQFMKSRKRQWEKDYYPACPAPHPRTAVIVWDELDEQRDLSKRPSSGRLGRPSMPAPTQPPAKKHFGFDPVQPQCNDRSCLEGGLLVDSHKIFDALGKGFAVFWTTTEVYQIVGAVQNQHFNVTAMKCMGEVAEDRSTDLYNVAMCLREKMQDQGSPLKGSLVLGKKIQQSCGLSIRPGIVDLYVHNPRSRPRPKGQALKLAMLM